MRNPFALAASVVFAAAAPLAAQATSPLAPQGVYADDLNRHVEACTDFYEFANGSWRAQNPIPASLPRWSRRVAAHESNWHRQQSVLEEVSHRSDWPAGSVEQLVGNHYASCMDETAVDAAGLMPLAPLLAEIDAIRDVGDVQRIIRRLHELSVPAPFTTNGEADFHDGNDFIENILPGTLGLPDRDYYVSSEPRYADARARYRVHVVKVFNLAGIPGPQADRAAADIFALEKRLAESSLDSATASDAAATDHKMGFAQLRELTPHIDWNRYFTDAKLLRFDVSVAEPKFMAQLDQELKNTPVETWKAYLKWQLLESASPWLSKPFASESFNFRDRYLAKAGQMKPRAQRCVESTDTLFGEALGKKYVQAYFPPASKTKATEIVRNLQAALKERINAAVWMERQTKQKALEKLAATDIQIGYPDTWRDYSSVRTRRDAFWANVAAGRRFNVDFNRQQVGKPTNRDLWRVSPSSPDSYIILEINTMVLTAGTLQPPFFNPQASDAVNYGAMGIAVAHDLTHAIDATGAAIDLQLHRQNWWSEKDRQDFGKRGQCLIEQFEGYFIEPDVHHNGQRLRDETIADLAGVRISYLALEHSMQAHPVPMIDGFTPEQQFFIAWGQTTGHAMRLEAQRQLVRGDPHPVPKFRVIGPLSNSPEFQQAFSCAARAPMVRPLQTRCQVW
ncbi:MAG TPA: M13 family metallopeptidase [Steroidobacteraceae bacterium]|nr:M13 family metallopeptidase [Steroidobacteraceae bacterium]